MGNLSCCNKSDDWWYLVILWVFGAKEVWITRIYEVSHFWDFYVHVTREYNQLIDFTNIWKLKCGLV